MSKVRREMLFVMSAYRTKFLITEMLKWEPMRMNNVRKGYRQGNYFSIKTVNLELRRKVKATKLVPVNVNLSVNKRHTNKIIIEETPDVNLLTNSRYDVSQYTVYLCNGAFLFLIVQTFKFEPRQRLLRVRNDLIQ